MSSGGKNVEKYYQAYPNISLTLRSANNRWKDKQTWCVEEFEAHHFAAAAAGADTVVECPYDQQTRDSRLDAADHPAFNIFSLFAIATTASAVSIIIVIINKKCVERLSQ